ncbi:MAG: arginine N-succinyltransferase [Chlamydiales bacterium]|jgi:arginine N-succinyltransferase|nr:arginine N-succinyltransferase [Chlamydiales bacterium]
MILFRPIKESDYAVFLEMVAVANREGTHLPDDADLLKSKFHHALASFQGGLRKGGEFYLFFLEDTASKKVIGMSALTGQSGHVNPISTYHIREIHFAKEHHSLKEQKILHRQRLIQGPAELSFLFLLPEERKSGYGRLLSLGRLLFIAAFQSAFPATLMTALNGCSLKNGTSPFWENFGRLFFDIDSKGIWQMMRNEKEIEPFLPSYPVYLSLLPKEAQSSIGKAHPNVKPALKLLLQEGFQLTHDIHVIDGGPYIESKVQNIRSIKESKRASFAGCRDIQPQELMLIANTRKEGFRCIAAPLEKSRQSVYLSKEVKAGLQLKTGDEVIYTPMSIFNAKE